MSSAARYDDDASGLVSPDLKILDGEQAIFDRAVLLTYMSGIASPMKTICDTVTQLSKQWIADEPNSEIAQQLQRHIADLEKARAEIG